MTADSTSVQILTCPRCNSTGVIVARDMLATRHCGACRYRWLPSGRPAEGMTIPYTPPTSIGHYEAAPTQQPAEHAYCRPCAQGCGLTVPMLAHPQILLDDPVRPGRIAVMAVYTCPRCGHLGLSETATTDTPGETDDRP